MPSPFPSPLVSGFHPDPSVVRVDTTYYLVTSTFEYLPGLPIYSSPDLVTWTQIGNVADRADQVGLEHVPTPGGVWAPTIRHRDGLFYVIVTVMLGGRGCVVFTATDPSGPWSDGLPLPAVDGIDPDLAWDDEGVAYVTYARHPDAIQQVRVDLLTGAALEETRTLWSGSGLYATEGPHLYQRGAFWYLLVAEGGTDRGHAVSVARGPAPDGPFENFSGNPVLTARSSGSPIQNVGHADLVDTPTGETVAVMLGVRPVGLALAFSPLGRETFATTVTWVDDWPRFVQVTSGPATPGQDVTFDLTTLDDSGWIGVRQLPVAVAVTSADGLAMVGDGTDLDHPRPAFVGRRQRHLTATVSVLIDAVNGVGGLAARYAEDNFFAVQARGDGAVTQVTGRAVVAGLDRTWDATLPAGEVELRLEMTAPSSRFADGWVGGDPIKLVAAHGEKEVVLAELDGRHWTFETAKTFTGRVIGMYVRDGAVTFRRYRYLGSDGP